MLEVLGAAAATGEFWGALIPMLSAGLSFVFKHVNARLESKRRVEYLASFDILDKDQRKELKEVRNKVALLLECDEIVSQISNKNSVAYSTLFGVVLGLATFLNISGAADLSSDMQRGLQAADFLDPIMTLPFVVISTILGPKVQEIIVNRFELRSVAREIGYRFNGGRGGYVQMRARVERDIIEQLYRNVLYTAAPPAPSGSPLSRIKEY